MLDPSLIPFVQRLDRDPEDQEALQSLWRELVDRGEAQTLAVLAEKVAARRQNPSSAAELLHRAGELWSSEIGRDDRAISLWQKCLELDANHEASMISLAGAWVRVGKADLAASLHKRVLERVTDPRRKLPILEQIAAMRAAAGDVDGEIAALREIIALDLPIAATLEHRRSLARQLVQRARAAQPDSDGEAHPDVREAARLLGSIARAGGSSRSADFAAAAMALWPGDEDAFVVLQGALSMRHAELTTLRIRFLASNPTSRMASQVRGDLADGYLAAGRVDDAVAVLAAAAADDAGAAQRLMRLYERTGRHKDLALLLAATPLPSDGAQRIIALRRRATAHRAAGDRKAFLATLREVLDAVPADPEAFAEIERDCRLRGDVNELRMRLKAAAGVTDGDPVVRARQLREVAALAERDGSYDEAVTAWVTAASLAEKPEDADDDYEAITRVLSYAERWSELLDLLSERAKRIQDPIAQRRAWLRWVELHREHRPDATQEATVLKGLLSSAPDDDAVAFALVDAYRRAGNAVGAGEVFRGLVARATPENVASRWSQLAGHMEQVGDVKGALEAWHQARTHDPAHAMAWQAEERLLEQEGRHRELLDVLIAHAGHPVAAGRRAGDLYSRAAHLAASLGLDAEAARLAERALKFSPDARALHAMVSRAAHDEASPSDKVPHTETAEVPIGQVGDDEVPSSLFAAEGLEEAMVHDTGEFPAAATDEGGGVFVHDTGEHTPAQGTSFDDLHSSFASQPEEFREETSTRTRIAVAHNDDETVTRELPVVEPVDEDQSTHERSALVATEVPPPIEEHEMPVAPITEEPSAVVRTALGSNDAPAVMREVSPPVASPPPNDEDDDDATLTEDPRASLPPRMPEAPTHDNAPAVVAAPEASEHTDQTAEELDADDILVEVDLSSLEQNAPQQERMSMPPPEPPPVPRPSMPPPVLAAPAAEELPSIIVDDSLLDASSPNPVSQPTAPVPAPPPVIAPLVAAAPLIPPLAPPLSQMVPPLVGAPRPMAPSSAAPAPPVHSAPTPPVAPLAPTPPVVAPAPAALPPLSATAFVAQSPPLTQPTSLAPLSFNPQPAPPPPLAPLAFNPQPVAPLAPLVAVPLHEAPAAHAMAPLPPLTYDPGPAPTTSTLSPLNFVSGDPFAVASGDPFAVASGDPFAAAPAANAFVAGPSQAVFSNLSGDPFAATAAPAVPVMPPASPFQRTMANMLEQSLASFGTR